MLPPRSSPAGPELKTGATGGGQQPLRSDGLSSHPTVPPGRVEATTWDTFRRSGLFPFPLTSGPGDRPCARRGATDTSRSVPDAATNAKLRCTVIRNFALLVAVAATLASLVLFHTPAPESSQDRCERDYFSTTPGRVCVTPAHCYPTVAGEEGFEVAEMTGVPGIDECRQTDRPSVYQDCVRVCPFGAMQHPCGRGSDVNEYVSSVEDSDSAELLDTFPWINATCDLAGTRRLSKDGPCKCGKVKYVTLNAELLSNVEKSKAEKIHIHGYYSIEIVRDTATRVPCGEKINSSDKANWERVGIYGNIGDMISLRIGVCGGKTSFHTYGSQEIRLQLDGGTMYTGNRVGLWTEVSSTVIPGEHFSHAYQTPRRVKVKELSVKEEVATPPRFTLCKAEDKGGVCYRRRHCVRRGGNLENDAS